MKDNFFSKNKKILMIFSPLFILGILAYMAVFQLTTLVSLGFRTFTYGTMSPGKVIIQEGSTIHSGAIEIIDSKIYYNKELIADTPKLVINYKDFKIDEIKIENPKIKFVRNGSDVNFGEIFTGPPREDYIAPDKSKKKIDESKKKLPVLKRINITGAELEFVDRSYSEEISQTAYDVNGFIQFEKGYDIYLEFLGTNEKEKYYYSFEKFNNFYTMHMKLSDIKANAKLLQYAYDSEGDLSDASGTVNLNMIINSNGMYGRGNLKNGEVLYKDLGVPAKDINLDFKFLGDEIKVSGDYTLLENKGTFGVNYQKDKGVQVDFDLKDILYKDLANYKYLKESNLEFDNLMFNNLHINMSTEEEFKVTIDFDSKDGFKKEVLSMADISGQFIYQDGMMKVNDLKGDATLAKAEGLIERSILADMSYKNKKGELDIVLQSKKEEFLSKIDLGLLFKVTNSGVKFKLNSSVVDVVGEYNYKKHKLFMSQKDNFKLEYDIESKKIEELKGYISLDLDNYNVKSDISLEDEKIIHVKTNITDGTIKVGNTSVGNIIGKINLDQLVYNFKINTKGITLAYKDILYSGRIDGKLSGRKDRFIGEFEIDKTSFGTRDEKEAVEDILGTVYVEKTDELSVIFQGEVGNIKYDKNQISGLKVSAKFDGSDLKILDIRNKFLTLRGNYSIINSYLDLFIKGFEIDEKIIKVKDLNYKIKNIGGHIYGKVDDLKGDFSVREGDLKILTDKEIFFDGDIKYYRNKVYSDEFFVNKNKIAFTYDLKESVGDYKVSIFEDQLSSYIKNVKFTIEGESTGRIKGSEISGNFKGSVDEVYYRGNKIPNISINCSYNNNELNFKDISLLSFDNKVKLFKAKGLINIPEKKIDFKIPKQTLLLERFIKHNDLLGNIRVHGGIKGTFDEITYNLQGNDGIVSYNNIMADDIKFSLDGDKDKLNLANFSMTYEDNKIVSNGEYNILENKYDFKLNSKEIDLKFILAFLKPYGIDDVSGRGDIDLEFTDVTPQGAIKLNNFSLQSTKYGVNLDDFNGKIKLQEGFLRIDKLSGILNEGSLNMKGFLELKKTIGGIVEDDVQKFNYSLLLDGRNIKYAFEDYFDLDFNARISLRNNNIFGNVIINEGEVNKIVDKDLGVVKIVKDFIKEFFQKNKINKNIIETTEILNDDEETPSNIGINLGFRIDQGIKINVAKVTGLVTDLKGTVFGQGTFRGNLGKINFLGENDIKDGEFVLNGNKFVVDRAVVLFNNRNEYIPDINPNISFSTSSVIDNKNIEFDLDGHLDSLIFTLRNGNDVSVNRLDSIVGDEGIKSDGDTDTSLLIANLIGGQITDVVLSPFVKVLRSIGFKNLRVKSSIVAKDDSKKNHPDDETAMKFGAYIEAESPIYKDKVFWRIKANFTEDSDDYSSKEGRKEYGIADYDVNLYHKLNKNVSWGVGAQKLKEDLETKGNRDVNYYIELKFEKRFNFRNGGIE